MKQNNYTASDIERYYSGAMPAAEMNALEKTALDDPFLSDALEGYTNTQTPSTDLVSLQKRLQSRIEKKEDNRKVFSIGNNWMKIAALFILFAGGGWLVFQTFSDKKLEVATNKTVEKQNPQQTINTSDSATVYSDAPSKYTMPSNQSASQLEENSKIESKPNKPSSNEKDLVVLQPQRQGNVTFPSVSYESSFDSLQTIAKSRFETPVYKKEASGDSLLARSYGYNKDNRAKESENFSSRSNPSSTDRKLSGKMPGVKSDTVKNLDVVLQSIPMADEEVVIVNKNKAVARQDSRRRMQVTVDTLEPAEGWTNFGDYIATNMRSQEEFKAKPTSGEVELSFEVNTLGEPVNITVVRSLCEKCEEEAIRLLKEGPKWKKNKKRGTVRFSF